MSRVLSAATVAAASRNAASEATRASFNEACFDEICFIRRHPSAPGKSMSIECTVIFDGLTKQFAGRRIQEKFGRFFGAFEIEHVFDCAGLLVERTAAQFSLRRILLGG